MTNYPAMLAAVAALFAGACPAAETSAAEAGRAGARPPAAPRRFTQAPGTGSLTFSFMQAGAENHGSFRQFATELTYDPKDPAASSLKVTVQIGSLDTQDKDRNDTLDERGAVRRGEISDGTVRRELVREARRWPARGGGQAHAARRHARTCVFR